MIDVLLVLLVIFMVTIPLNQRGIDVTLPESSNTPDNSVVSRHIVATSSR